MTPWFVVIIAFIRDDGVALSVGVGVVEVAVAGITTSVVPYNSVTPDTAALLLRIHITPPISTSNPIKPIINDFDILAEYILKYSSTKITLHPISLHSAPSSHYFFPVSMTLYDFPSVKNGSPEKFCPRTGFTICISSALSTAP
jgi:hypothetical protein